MPPRQEIHKALLQLYYGIMVVFMLIAWVGGGKGRLHLGHPTLGLGKSTVHIWGSYFVGLLVLQLILGGLNFVLFVGTGVGVAQGLENWEVGSGWVPRCAEIQELKRDIGDS